MPLNLDKNIGEKISELMDEHGVSAEKLSQATNIPLRFINYLKDNELERLPAPPYIRGYLVKISSILKFDEEELIKIYKESLKIKKSGYNDKLPENQFARIPLKKGSLIASAIFLIIIIGVYTRFDDILGVPQIQIEIPSTSQIETINISGTIKPGDKITLNGEPVYADENGRFEEEFPLSVGLNILEFKVKRFLGRESVVTKQVYYEPIEPTQAVSPS